MDVDIGTGIDTEKIWKVKNIYIFKKIRKS
jgi:hypothetical protein